jgi:hypothetical protein
MARRKTQTEPDSSHADGDSALTSTEEAPTQNRDTERDEDSGFQKLSEKKDRVFNKRDH